MHSGAKWTMIVGGVMLLIGIGGFVIAGSGAEELEADWVREGNDWNGTEGTYTHEVGDMMYVFVPRDDPDRPECSDFELNVTKTGSNDSESLYIHDRCTPDGKLPEGYGDDPLQHYHYGAIKGLEVGESYEIGSEVTVYLINQEVLDEVIGDFLGVIFGVLGGGGCACCGVLIAMIGGVMALTMKEESPVTIVYDAEGRVIVQGAVTAPGMAADVGSVAPVGDHQSWESGLASQTEEDPDPLPEEEGAASEDWWDQEDR